MIVSRVSLIAKISRFSGSSGSLKDGCCGSSPALDGSGRDDGKQAGQKERARQGAQPPGRGRALIRNRAADRLGRVLESCSHLRF